MACMEDVTEEEKLKQELGGLVLLLKARDRPLRGRFLRITGQRLRFYHLHNVSNEPVHFRLNSTYKPSSCTVTLTFSYVNARRAVGLFPVMLASSKIKASSTRYRSWSKRISGEVYRFLIVPTRLPRALRASPFFPLPNSIVKRCNT